MFISEVCSAGNRELNRPKKGHSDRDYGHAFHCQVGCGLVKKSSKECVTVLFSLKPLYTVKIEECEISSLF